MVDSPRCVRLSSAVPRLPRNRRRIELAAIGAILAFGATLRVIQYAAQGSMWLDELSIAVNVAGRDLGSLVFEALDHRQVAPPGFLGLEKLGGLLLGHREAGLRLFPWLASLAALPLFWRVATRFVSGVELVAGLLVVAASPALVWYATNAKQYSGDVAVTLLLLLLALRVDEGRSDTRGAALAGVAGGLAILASQPAVLVAFGLCAALLVRRLSSRPRRSPAPVVALAAGWAVGAAAVTAAALLLVPSGTRGFMANAWAGSFFPFDGIDTRTFQWAPTKLLGILGHLLVYVQPKSLAEEGFVATFAALAVVGAWALARQRPAPAALLAVPVAVALLAAVVRLYPLHHRPGRFVAPSLLVAAMAGAADVRARLPARVRSAAAVLVLGLFALPAVAVLVLAPPPYRSEESRPVLEALAARWRPGDAIYVYGAASLAMRFYGPPVAWTAGSLDRTDSRTYFRELDRVRGRPRVWFFVTHGFPCEPEAIRSYLEAIGRERERIEDPYGNRGQRAAAAYLFDLSDPVRLARADAETHPHPRATTIADSRVEGCGYTRVPGRVGLQSPLTILAARTQSSSGNSRSR